VSALRTLCSDFNLMMIPPEHGGIAEIQGPPGPNKWHMIVHESPDQMRRLVQTLEPPLESALGGLRPFRRVQTPTNELHRFDTMAYLYPVPRVTEVKWTLHVEGEELVWVSPKEALARHDRGVFDVPTPTLMLLHELDRHCPRYVDVLERKPDQPPEVFLPELVHDPATRMATVLLPDDYQHSRSLARSAERTRRQTDQKAATAAAASTMSDEGASAATATAAAAEEPEELPMLSRIEYVKNDMIQDGPGVRSIFHHRAVTAADLATEKLPDVPAARFDEVRTKEGEVPTPEELLQYLRRADTDNPAEVEAELALARRERRASLADRRASLAAAVPIAGHGPAASGVN